MRPNCSWNRIGAVTSGLALAGCLALTSRPATAQQTVAVSDTTPLTLLMVIFPDTTAAQSAMTNLTAAPTAANAGQPTDKAAPPPNTVGNPAPVQWVEPYYAVATKDKNGKVNVQYHGTKGSTASDTRADNSIDGVSALLAQRSSKSNKNGGQAGAGASRAGISSADMSDMQNVLVPGNTALIIVVPTADVADATTDLKQANATQVHDAPLVAAPSK